MRFKIKPKPEYCSQRTKIKFAFFPVEIKGYWVWLENYKSEQIFNVWEEWEEYYKSLINKNHLSDGKGDLSCITKAAENIERKYGKGQE